MWRGEQGTSSSFVSFVRSFIDSIDRSSSSIREAHRKTLDLCQNDGEALTDGPTSFTTGRRDNDSMNARSLVNATSFSKRREEKTTRRCDRSAGACPQKFAESLSSLRDGGVHP